MSDKRLQQAMKNGNDPESLQWAKQQMRTETHPLMISLVKKLAADVLAAAERN